jgi:hypothetical protein
MIKTRRRRTNSPNSAKKIREYQRIIKGRLFEIVMNELIKKSGFSQDETFPQLNVKKTKIFGRGASHQIDIIGVFKLGIPFINPLLLIGEAKNFQSKIGLSAVQSFLGTCIDIFQYSRIRTKFSMDIKRADIFEPKHTYCPVFFSMKGFARNAENLMFVHGINYFSYENSAIMQEIDQLVGQFLKQIRYNQIKTTDFKFFRELSKLKEIRQEVKKQSYDYHLKNLTDSLIEVSSYVGVLDKRFPIHILTRKKNIPRSSGEVKIDRISDNSLVLKTLNNRQYGQFSLNTSFLDEYLKFAYKRKYLDNTLRQIDLIVPQENSITVFNLKISDESRKSIIDNYVKIPDTSDIIII